tara:strand:- start:645 stop:1058 length:414 start_codon:yes stop_codon:yes gene_type:complete
MTSTQQQRRKFLEMQRVLFKQKTNHVTRTIKEERFDIEDDHYKYHKAYMSERSADFGILMCLTTRKKIHIKAYEIMKKMRNYDDNVDTIRLRKLIHVHKHQLRKSGTAHQSENVKFYDDMIEAIEHNLHWLRILKCG